MQILIRCTQHQVWRHHSPWKTGREIFKIFQAELFECFGYIAKKIDEQWAIFTYMVAKFGKKTRLTLSYFQCL